MLKQIWFKVIYSSAHKLWKEMYDIRFHCKKENNLVSEIKQGLCLQNKSHRKFNVVHGLWTGFFIPHNKY